MKFRTYLRLYQPIPALLMTAALANGATGFGVLLFGLSESDSRLLALLTAVPVLLGMDLASAAHTALHRPFAPLLPDMLDRVQRATLWAALVCNLAITLAVGWFSPAAPAAAVFGFVAPLLLLPCFNRRRLVTRPGVFNISVNIAGLQFHLLGILGWAAFMKLAGQRLVPAMQAAPWLFFAGGLAAAAWLLRLAFTRESLRERAETPFFSPNAAWRLVFSPKIVARHQEEARQHIARFGAGSAQQQLADRTGHDWTVRSVGPRTRDWLRVYWHATYGAMRRGSFFHTQGHFFLVLLAYAFLLPCLGFLSTLLEKRPFGLAGYLEALAWLGHLNFLSATSPIQAGIALMSLILLLGFTFVLTLTGNLPPRLPYPVSRQRLSRVSFAHALLQLGFALLVPTAALFATSLCGQALSGHYLPAFGMLPLLKLDLILLPLLLLVATAGRFRSMAVRLPVLIGLAIAGCALAVSREWWEALVTTLPGFLAIALLTVGATFLLRWQIRRHFRTCDLVAEAAEARSVVFAATFSFNRAPAAT